MAAILKSNGKAKPSFSKHSSKRGIPLKTGFTLTTVDESSEMHSEANTDSECGVFYLKIQENSVRNAVTNLSQCRP